MAFEFILPAINQHLIATCGPILDSKNCSIEPDGRPPGYAGDFYCSIDEAGCSPAGAIDNEHITMRHDVLIVLSIRMGIYATDTTGYAYTNTAWLKYKASFAGPEKAIRHALHGNHAVRQLAQQLAQGSGYNFTRALYYTGRGRTKKAGLDWDGGAQPIQSPDDMPWLVRELRFTGFDATERLHVQIPGPG